MGITEEQLAASVFAHDSVARDYDFEQRVTQVAELVGYERQGDGAMDGGLTETDHLVYRLCSIVVAQAAALRAATLEEGERRADAQRKLASASLGWSRAIAARAEPLREAIAEPDLCDLAKVADARVVYASKVIA